MSEMYDAGIHHFPYLQERFRILFRLLNNFSDIYSRCIHNRQTVPNLKRKSTTEYQKKQPTIARPSENDRVFPLETVQLNMFKREHESKIDTVTIHTGPYADEYTRSLNALAITIGTGIFFRNNRFDTASEEGRKTLTHELTHIDQFIEGRINENSTRNELEQEAENAEQHEMQNPDSIMTINIKGKLYSFPRSKMKHYAEATADKIEEWVSRQKNIMEEEEYLNLLCSYSDWCEGKV
jgi:hypothetical protein